MTIDFDYYGTMREVSTDLGVLRYQEAGDPRWPPLVLLHGSGPGVSGAGNFREILPTLSEFFHCFVLEFPGFGVSDDFGGHPMMTARDATVRFLDALSLETVHVLGNSMGGIVGAELAIEYPHRIGRLVTIGGIGTPTLGPALSEGIRLLMEFTDDPSRARLIRWLYSMVYDPEVVTDELVEQRWELATEPKTLDSARRMYSTAAMTHAAKVAAESDEPPYWSKLHKIQSPTLLTWGRDDRVSPLDMALLPLRTIPDASLHVFPQCGHWVMIEQKEAFENAVIPFLIR